jgi:hypothetical protein
MRIMPEKGHDWRKEKNYDPLGIRPILARESSVLDWGCWRGRRICKPDIIGSHPSQKEAYRFLRDPASASETIDSWLLVAQEGE